MKIRKTNKQAILIISAIVIVLAVSITVPIVKHNEKIKVESIETTSSAKTTASAISSTKEAEHITEPAATEASTEIKSEKAISEKAEINAVSSSAKNVGSAVTTQKPTSTKSASVSTSTTKKAVSTTKPATTTKISTTAKPTTTKPQSTWTQAKVNSIVAEMKSYCISKNMGIDSSLTTSGTSWMNPANTAWSSDPERIRSNLKYQIDQSYNQLIDCGITPDGRPSMNVLAIPYTDYDGTTQWEIYVVY